MVASTSNRSPTIWIGLGCLIGLAACLIALGVYHLIGAGAYLFAGAKPVPGDQLPFERAGADCNQGTLLNQGGKFNEAIEAFRETLALDPGNAAAYRGKGEAYLKKGLPEQALLDLNEAVRLAPGSAEGFRLRARAYLAAREYNAAADDARRAIQLDANCGDAYVTLGTAVWSSPGRDRSEALKCLDQAICIYKGAPPADPDAAEEFYRLSVRLGRVGRLGDAERAIVQTMLVDPNLVALLPDDREAAIATGLVFAKAGLDQRRFDDALIEFTAVLHLDPKNVQALRGRGSAFLGKEDWDSALVDFNELVELAPNSAEAHCLRCQAYLKKGNSIWARWDATEAIRLQPDCALAYYYRADAYYREQKFEPAIASAFAAADLERKLLPRNPGLEGPTWDLLVQIYQGQARDYERARQWEKVIDNLLAIDNLELPKLTLGHFPEAQHRQQLAQAYQHLGSDRLESHNWDGAINSFANAIDSFTKAVSLEGDLGRQLNPELALTYAQRGSAYANRGDFPAAVADLNRALDLCKDSAQIYRLRGLTCCLMAEDCRLRGMAACEKAEWDAAIDNLDRAIRLDRSLENELRGPLADAGRSLARIRGR